MRITICCKQYGEGGGAEKFLRNFARSLLREGHQVRVLAAEFSSRREHVKTVRLPVPPAPRTLRDLLLARASRKALASEEADVTFSDQKCWGADVVRPGGGVQREYVKQRRKTFRSPLRRAVKQAIYALSIRERLRIYIDDRLYREPGPRLVIANSRMVRRNLERHYPHLEDRIEVVYNGTDPERFSPALRDEHRERVRRELGIPGDAHTLVFVGTGWRRKGLFPLLEALGVLAARGQMVHLIVVGRGKRRRAVSLAERRGVAGLLHLVGRIGPEPYYGAADVLALPSFFDPCANVTLEALACGLPVVTSVFNGAHELLTPGRHGFCLEDPADADGLAEAIERTMDPDWLPEASQCCRSLALDHTVEDMYGEIISAIAPLAGE